MTTSPAVRGLALTLLAGLGLLAAPPAAKREAAGPGRLDPALRDAMVAALPRHSIPVTLDITDGYSFSVLQRSAKTGAVDFFEETSLGPFRQDGHVTQHQLSWNRGEADGFLNCDPGQAVHSVSDTITNQVVLHFSVDTPGAPGGVTALNVVIPSFDEQPPATTSALPIAEVGVSATIRSGGSEVSGTVAPAPPPAGAAANYLLTLPAPFPLGGTVEVDVQLAGAVQPALGTPRTAPLGCPPPNSGLFEIQAFGTSQLLFQNLFLVLFLQAPGDPGSLVVDPGAADVESGDSVVFTAWDCPPGEGGAPDVGPDGRPGTDDDECEKTQVEWSVSSGVGGVSPAAGSATTYTAADAAPGQILSGAVIAQAGDRSGFANLTLTGRDVPETHRINLEVERMFRQGLPLAEDAPAGATQVVVRPTTARELDESLGTMVVGGVVLPFDARASLLGELATAPRTIQATDPADLAAMGSQIRDDIDASGRDSSDPREVARFLRRNPGRGRVTLTLDEAIERDLLSDRRAYVGSVDAGFLGFRPDLLLREAQRPFVVPFRSGDRDVQVRVDFVENEAITNVLPYDGTLTPAELNRLRRSPARGGIFQGADAPNTAQLIAVADGGGRESRTSGRESAALYTARVGEDSERAAHALAHLAGHLLFGRRHERTSELFVMNDRAREDSFFADNFDDLRYSDRTVRRGYGNLDRYWRR